MPISGGGAASDIWCQIFADILDRQILQVYDPIKANARGAAFIGAVGIGELDFEEAAKRVKVRAAYEPDSANRQLYDERYGIFRQFYKKTKGIYQQLNRHQPT